MAPRGRGRGRGRRRGKEEQRQWLEQKRQQPSAKEECEADGERGGGRAGAAEEDFRAYYEAQRLFGDAPEAAAEFEALWKALRSPLPVTVRINTQSPAAARTEMRLIRDGWERRQEFDRTGLSIWQLDDARYSGPVRKWAERENRSGALSFQELVSLVPALLLAPRPHDLCLDLCAAPGSKSSQLVEAMDRQAAAAGTTPTGAVLSGDADAQRCCLALYRVLAKTTSPASCAVLANAKDFPTLLDPASAASSGGSRVELTRILADVPCSGDGTTRKNAQVWRSWNRKEALGLFSLQRNILMRGLFLLPPGGVLVYSTCSLNPLEDEAVVLAALKRWRERDCLEPVTLVDTSVACKDICDLPVAGGLTQWVVPAPSRRGPLFSHWDEVPEELRGDAPGLLRPEMFCEGGAEADELRRCARFFPHRGDVGGFFAAVIRKDHTVPRPLPCPADGVGNVAARAKGGGPNLRQHPLLQARFSRISSEDVRWRELADFFGVDAAWAEDKISRGLLFWQFMHQKEEPSRVALASEGVARMWQAQTGSGRELPWVRLGLFLFEQLPKGFLTGIAATRWRATVEGCSLLDGVLDGRRRMWLPADELQQVLGAEHRQVPLEHLPGLSSNSAYGNDVEGSQVAGFQGACGGVFVGVLGGGPWAKCWLPGALTPRQLRLLVDDDVALSLLDALAEDTRQHERRSCCWAGLAALISGRSRLRSGS